MGELVRVDSLHLFVMLLIFIYIKFKKYHKHAFKYHQLDSAEQMPRLLRTKFEHKVEYCSDLWNKLFNMKLIFSSPFYYVYANFINNSNTTLKWVSAFVNNTDRFVSPRVSSFISIDFRVVYRSDKTISFTQFRDTYKPKNLTLVSFNAGLCDHFYSLISINYRKFIGRWIND